MATATLASSNSKGYSGKTNHAYSRLRAIAHRLGPGAKMPTVQQLRQEIGVSLGTLNTALRDAEEQNILTRRHSVGIYVSPTLRKNVPLICNPESFRAANHSPFWDILLDQVLHHDTHGMNVVCQFAAPLRSEPLLSPGLSDEIAGGHIDGILGIGLLEDTARAIMAQGVPLAQMFGPGHVIVLQNTTMMADMAVTTLAGQGCRRIGMWSKDPCLIQDAFERALAAHGLPFHPALMRAGQDLLPARERLVTLSLPEQGFQLARETFCGNDTVPPDGLFIADDTMTRGALIALAKLGVKIGTDVKIVSHANRDTPTLLGHEGELMLTEFDPGQFVSALFDEMAVLLTLPELPAEKVILVEPQLRVS